MIELLESRIAPAGLIDVVFSHGNVQFSVPTGDAGDESAVLTRPAAETLVITPAADVSLRFGGISLPPGQPLSITEFTGDLRASLGGGNDSLTLSGGTYPGSIYVNLGGAQDRLGTNGEILQVGKNFLLADGIAVNGAFTIRGGAQPDSVELHGASFQADGSFSVSLGGGVNQFTADATIFQLGGNARVSSGGASDLLLFKSAKIAVAGNLSVASGGGSDTVQFTSAVAELAVNGNFAIASSGSRSAIIEQSLTGIAKIMIGGSLRMSAGTGDRVTQSVSATSGMLSIGSVLFLAANPTEHIQVISTSGEGITIGGAVAMKSHALNAHQTVSTQTTAPAVVAGPLSLRGGTSVVVALGGDVHEGLTVITAARHSASVSVSDATIDGNLRIITKDGFGLSAAISLSDLAVDGPVSIVGGIGATTLKVDQTLVGQSFIAALGDGANAFRIEQESQSGASIFTGNVELRGGNGADSFLIGGVGNNTIQFLAGVLANGAAGTDTLTEGDAVTHPAESPLVKRNIP